MIKPGRVEDKIRCLDPHRRPEFWPEHSGSGSSATPRARCAALAGTPTE